MVLRKQPPGKLLASAHAVHREFAVMKALARSPVPVPKALTLCRDPAVLGADFYTMEFVDGLLFLEPSMSDSTPGFRADVYRAMAGVTPLHKPTSSGEVCRDCWASSTCADAASSSSKQHLIVRCLHLLSTRNTRVCAMFMIFGHLRHLF
jgi:hypothetical protein